MPDKKKKATEMTTEELAHRVFPPEVVKELKRIAHEEPSKPRGPKPKHDKGSSND